MRDLLVILCVLCLVQVAEGQPGQPTQQRTTHRVYLLGNVADISGNSNFSTRLSQLYAQHEDQFTVLLNGDLVSGMANGRLAPNDSVKLYGLLQEATKMPRGRVVIVPGDRDWANSTANGWQSVRKLEKAIDKMGLSKVTWAVTKGCPGPKAIQLNSNLMLIVVSTQWWNHPFEKPDPASGDCKFPTQRDFMIEFENLIDDTEGSNILVAGHYPLKSLGMYGGYFPFWKRFAPPVAGSFMVGYRQNVGTHLDISNHRFEDIKDQLRDEVLRKRGVIYTSGHEQNLQVLREREGYFVNSGAPGTAAYTPKGNNGTLLAAAQKGLIELIYRSNGQVDYVAHSYDEEAGFGEYQKDVLYYSPCETKPIDGQLVNFNFNPCREQRKTAIITSKASSASMAAGSYPVKGFRKVLLGKHYRSTWVMPVTVPYLSLDTTYQGLIAYEKGGGHQTTSLKMKGGDGKEYAFRSVDKDPGQLLPFELKNTLVATLLKDVTSTQHPYGAMPIAKLLDQTEILHATPTLFVMPDTDELGPFRDDYKNLMGMLEEKPVKVSKVKVPFAGAEEILQSRKMFRELIKDHDDQINSQEYLEARIFDILVGDWGKHEDNWKWASYPKAHGHLYRPIPRDRDYAFSKWDGFLYYLADRKWANQNGEDFDYTINDVRSLTWSARHADRRLLNDRTKEDYLAAARHLQSVLTDEMIEKAFATVPEEVYDLSSEEVILKLVRRRNDLVGYAEEFYKLMQLDGVDVVGSNKKEFFEVTRLEDGSVKVMVYNTKDDQFKGERVYFDRTFKRGETKEIRLFGLEKTDHFYITGEVDQSIPIRIIGGPGTDVISDLSQVKSANNQTLIYEKEDGKQQLGEESKRIDHWNDALYNYDRHRFEYNRYRPILGIGFNSNDGLGLTAGVQLLRRSYAKQDFSAKHTFKAYVATENVNILDYQGQFHHTFGKWDLLVAANLSSYTSGANFFGAGNNTLKDDDLDAMDFYNTNYDAFTGAVGLMREFWGKSRFSISANYQKNDIVIEPGTVLELPADQLNALVEDTNLGEVILDFDIDFRDKSDLPEKGLRLVLRHKSGISLDDNDKSYGQSRISLEHYTSTPMVHPITLGVRVGASTSYNEELIPFHNLVYLGQFNGLRGFDRNRFTGKSLLYFNTDLRIEVAEFRTSLVPMKFGVKAFYDSGRVYSDFDVTNKWHQGYGAGLYVVPLKERFAISISAAFSDEETGQIIFSIGSTFR